MQYVVRRGGGGSSIYAKYSNMLIGHEPDEAYADYLCAQMEAEAAKDVNLSRLLTKLGPVLGLIGTLISMSPALVGLSTGDISGMAYNMQVVFSATVVGLVISVVGLFTQQLKSRWYQQDISRLEYAASQYMKGKKANEKEA
jgi:biopolymer transport protein ExbB/TolQ